MGMTQRFGLKNLSMDLMVDVLLCQKLIICIAFNECCTE
jgi:hypothetical protein